MKTTRANTENKLGTGADGTPWHGLGGHGPTETEVQTMKKMLCINDVGCVSEPWKTNDYLFLSKPRCPLEPFHPDENPRVERLAGRAKKLSGANSMKDEEVIETFIKIYGLHVDKRAENPNFHYLSILNF